MYQRSYSDDQLVAAVGVSRSWRGVLRALELKATSAGSMRSVRQHAERLQLSTAHFTGQRRWTEKQLRDAIAAASTWVEVASTVGLAPSGGATTTLRAHAVRLRIPTDHLAAERPTPDGAFHMAAPDPAHLRAAGSFIAAAWFTLRDATVSWPLEPCRYDLIATIDGALQRIQVKTTVGAGCDALVTVSSSRRRGRAVYGPDEIDFFFVVDGALDAYLIPYAVVAGYTTVKLGQYVHFKVVEHGALLSAVSSP